MADSITSINGVARSAHPECMAAPVTDPENTRLAIWQPPEKLVTEAQKTINQFNFFNLLVNNGVRREAKTIMRADWGLYPELENYFNLISAGEKHHRKITGCDMEIKTDIHSIRMRWPKNLFHRDLDRSEKIEEQLVGIVNMTTRDVDGGELLYIGLNDEIHMIPDLQKHWGDKDQTPFYQCNNESIIQVAPKNTYCTFLENRKTGAMHAGSNMSAETERVYRIRSAITPVI